VGLLDGLKEKVRQRDRARLEKNLDPEVTRRLEDQRAREAAEAEAERRRQEVLAQRRAAEADRRQREEDERRRAESDKCNKCKGTGRYSYDDGERRCPKCRGSGKK